MISEIVAPFNGSEDAVRTVRVAARLANLAGQPLKILTYSEDPDILASSPELTSEATDLAHANGVQAVVAPLPKSRFVSDELVSQASKRPGTLLCIPSHGLGRMAILRRSLSTSVLIYNPWPVVVVGDHCEPDLIPDDGPVVVALDGSEASETILSAAHEWAQLFSLPVEVVEVVDPEPAPELAAAIASGDIHESSYISHAAEHSALEGDDVTFDVLHDHKPAEAILRQAAVNQRPVIRP